MIENATVYLIAALTFMIPLQADQMLFAPFDARKRGFWYRIVVMEAGYIILAVLSAWTIAAGFITAQNPLVYVLMYGYTYLIFFVCFSIPHIEIIFVTSCGYAVQHIGMALANILTYIMQVWGYELWNEALFEILLQCMVTFLAYLILIRPHRFSRGQRERDPRMIMIALIILFSCLFLNILVYDFSEKLGAEVQIFSDVFCKMYAILCCILAIYIEYAVSYMNYMNKQQEFMEQLIRTQGSQIQMSQESVSIINRKCHDIKYQLKALQFMDNEGKRMEQIGEIKKAISIYDSIYHTGNEALDLLLREKTLLCEEYAIQFSCMADGGVLDFISIDDLYVLLGNALDNAIESVMKEEDISKRVISLYIGMKNGMRCIHLENYCKEQVQIQNGIPQTSKEDKAYHGYGMHSMVYLAEKYHGQMIARQRDNTFHLNFLFPQQKL